MSYELVPVGDDSVGVVVPPVEGAQLAGLLDEVERVLRNRDRTPLDPRLVELRAAFKRAARASGGDITVPVSPRRNEMTSDGDRPHDEFMMSTEAARKLMGVTRRRVQQLAKAGLLPGAVRRSRDWWIPRSAVDACLLLSGWTVADAGSRGTGRTPS